MAAKTRNRPVGGPELARSRRRVGVTQAVVASAMGSTFRRVSELEHRAAVPDAKARLYVEALRKAVAARADAVIAAVETLEASA
jgi:hypothetical protein